MIRFYQFWECGLQNTWWICILTALIQYVSWIRNFSNHRKLLAFKCDSTMPADSFGMWRGLYFTLLILKLNAIRELYQSEQLKGSFLPHILSMSRLEYRPSLFCCLHHLVFASFSSHQYSSTCLLLLSFKRKGIIIILETHYIV